MVSAFSKSTVKEDYTIEDGISKSTVKEDYTIEDGISKSILALNINNKS